MFFSHQLLILKKSSFSLIWRYMHDRNHKVSKRELLKIDVGQACEDLRNYVPTGKLEQAEVQNKMSLYLLAQLTYGVVLVHNVQADFLIADLKQLHNSLARHPPEEPLAIEDDTDEKKKKTPRSKRKKPEVDDDDEEELADEEDKGRKRRRTTKGKKPKQPQLLDLSDARSYVDGLVPGQSKPPVDEFNELEDNFMDQSETTERLPPPEWPPLSEPLKASAYDLLSPEEANAHFLREVERALMAGREPVRASVDMGEESQLDVTADVHQEIDQQPMVESGSVYAPSEGIQLEPLPDEPRRGKKGRGKKRKGPIIDKATQIPLEVMMEHMMDIGPTIRTMADLRREREEREYRTKVPHADVLFSTHSENIQNFVNNLDEDLRYMFDLRTYKPPTYEENCKRWAAVEKTFGSGPFGRLPSEPDLDQSELPGADFMLGRDDGPKISVFDETLVEERDGGQRISIFGESLVEGRDSVLSEVEEARQARLTLQRSLSGRTGEPSAHQPLVDLDVSHVSDSIPMADLSLADQDTLGAEDIQLQRESLLVKPSPDRSEEQDWSSDTSKQLYSSILNKTQEQGRRSIYFHEAAEVDKLDLKQAARSFFSLLCLLKQGKVKARRQQQPFGKIEIRVRGHHDRTMEEEEEEQGAGEHEHDGGEEMAEET